MKTPQFAALIAALLLAAGAAWAEDAVKVVRLAAILPQSGPWSTPLMRLKQAPGTALAVEEINRQGGLLGHKVELVAFDSQSTALGARAAARQAIALRPIAVIGERISTMSLVIAPMLQQAGIPMISPGSTHPDVTRAGDYIFRVCLLDSFTGRALADFAWGELGARRAVVLTNASRKNSTALAQYFAERFRQRGGAVLFEGDYVADRTDFAELVEQVVQRKPDVLFLPGGPLEIAAIMRLARARGVTAHFLGGDSWSNDLYKAAGAALDGAYHSEEWHRSLPGAASARYVSLYEARFGEARASGEALAYDAVMVLADAVRRAGSFEPAKVRAALASTHGFVGVTGSITLDAGRNPVKPLFIVRHKGPRIEFVKALEP